MRAHARAPPIARVRTRRRALFAGFDARRDGCHFGTEPALDRRPPRLDGPLLQPAVRVEMTFCTVRLAPLGGFEQTLEETRMTMMRRDLCRGFVVGCACVSIAGPAEASTSIFARRVGKILPSNQTAWCSIGAEDVNGVYSAVANMELENTDGTAPNPSLYNDPKTLMTLKMQCYNVTNGTITNAVYSKPLSTNVTLPCPGPNQIGYYVSCQINNGTDSDPFVYDGNGGGDVCGNGVSSISVAGSSHGYLGQVTGQSALMTYTIQNPAIFNAATMGTTQAQVWGTDLGYMFYADGELWSGYGDTWAQLDQQPEQPTNYRGSVVFKTNNLSVLNGLKFNDYVGSTLELGPGWATEIVPSCHGTNCGSTPEVDAIASAGFGLSEAEIDYHFFWFTSIKAWGPPFVSNVSSIAWNHALNGYTRGDQATGPGGVVPPRWTPNSNFGTGAVWQDRANGYIYFFGTKPYQANETVELARVPAKVASVLDHTQYQYWDGKNYETVGNDTKNPSTAELNAKPIVTGISNMGPEFSVAFDAYTNTFLMTVVSNRAASYSNGQAAMQLWQAQFITGPWSLVSTGTTLPNYHWTDVAPAGFNYFYGPNMSEQLMQSAGQSVYYQLSEWAVSTTLFYPYNTGLWAFNVARSSISGCQ
jgi:hypothetical protein